MWRRFTREQNGSLAPVAVFIFLCVVLLFAFVLDREWVNYRMRLVEQTADFAAEAGAQHFEVHYSVVVTKRQLYRHWYEVCDEWEFIEEFNWYRCVSWREEFEVHQHFDSERITGTKERLERDWKSMARCDHNPWSPSWQCWDWQIDNPRGDLVFSNEAVRTAETVFNANLPAHARPVITMGPQVSFNTRDRDVKVTVMVELGSLFGWGRRQVTITGRAISQYELLNLTM